MKSLVLTTAAVCVLLLLMLLSPASCQNSTSSSCEGCIPANCPEATLCDAQSTSKRIKCVTYYSHVRMAVELNNYIDPPRYYGFCIRLDEFAQLSVMNVYDYMAKNRNSTVRVFMGDGSSPVRYFFNILNKTAESKSPTATDVLVNFYTVKVTMLKGVVSDQLTAAGEGGAQGNGTVSQHAIAWDNSCDPSLENGCIFDMIDCVRRVDCGVIDDPAVPSASKMVKIYVTFTGDDSVSNPLKSSSFMPSRYRQYSLGKYYDTIAKSVIPKTNSN